MSTMSPMSRVLTVTAIAATLVFAAGSAQAHDQRHDRHHHHHAGFFFGAPFYSSYARDTGGCTWTRLRVWTGATWRLRRVQVCG